MNRAKDCVLPPPALPCAPAVTVDELGLSDRLRSPPSDSGGLSPPAGYPAAPTTQMSAVPATRGAWNTEV